jgi:uncharacterized protein (DUF1015 family)
VPLIAPFRGLRYSQAAGPPEAVISPAWDVVTPQEQAIYLALHRHNFIHLIAPCQEEGGLEKAASTFKQWQREGVLVRDPEPAVYLYQIFFRLVQSGPVLTRTGLICLMELTDYQAGQVRPHEQTFTSIKGERLDSLCSCEANLSMILTFFDDQGLGVVDRLKAAAPSRPNLEFRDEGGMTHRLWLVKDPEVLSWLARSLVRRPFYVADGHHRYESCLAHRDLMREFHPQTGPLAPFNYTLVHAVPMGDPGLCILPFHRLIKHVSAFSLGRFLDLVGEDFEIYRPPLFNDSAAARREFKSLLTSAGEKTVALGLLAARSERFHLLSLKTGVLERLAKESGLPPQLRELDVVVLEELILKKCLGLGPEDWDDKTRFAYESDLDAVVRAVQAQEARLGFVLNPTRVEQVRAVAEAGLTMPRKSTFFYPKIPGGLVMSPIEAEEEVPLPSDLIPASPTD